MKFSRMPPRPLETFHSVDEKRPRITFTKYIRGILNVFVGRLLDPFSFSFFFSSSSFPWNTILWLVFRKKKKGVSNPLSLPRRTSEGADQKGRARRSNGREKKMKKGRQEVCFFPRCVKRIPRRLTNPELAVSGKGVNVAADRFANMRDREGRRERFYEIFNLQTSITIYATANHLNPCRIRQTARAFLRFEPRFVK